MKKNLLGLILSIFIFFIPTVVFADSTSDRIHFISSTTEGDSMIIESNGHYGLIDAMDASNGTKVKNYADALGVTHFDFVIMTHNHPDSIGGIPALASLIDSDTIVFYKEDLTTTDDYEEVSGLQNNYYFGLALQTFNGSKKCDVTKASLLNDSACDLSTLSNSTITSVTYDDNNELTYASNVRENLSFDFGDFNIKLYSLYSLSYHKENLNSIITVVEQKETGTKAALTADIEAAIGDADYAELTGRSQLITDPTGECDPSDPGECSYTSIESQIADVIGIVDLLKVANHGDFKSNTLSILDSYMPGYFILESGSMTNADGNVEFAFSYLRNAFGTESYLSSQTQGALVAEFSELSNGISIKNFDATATDTQTEPLNMGTSSFTNGWKAMHYTGLDDVVKGYVENGQFVKNAWKNIAVNSTTYTFHFEDTEIMTTGFYFDEDDEEEPDEGEEESGGEEEQETIPEVHAYYFCDDNIVNTSCELGAMQTGLQTIHNDSYGNDYKYYFRTSANQFSEGAKGEMVTGLTAVGPTDDDTYYFRKKEDEILPGPVGSALTNGCVRPDSQNLSTKICFDGDGKKTTGNIPSTIPTTDLCSNAFYQLEEVDGQDDVYVGVSQSVTNMPAGAYTWVNNMHTNVGSYTVTAVLDNDSYWDTGTPGDMSDRANKTITCTISPMRVSLPTLEENSFLSGEEIDIVDYFDEDDYEEGAYVFSGDQIKTAIGSYTLGIGLSDTTNMAWADGADPATIKSIQWYITASPYATPAVNPVNVQYDGQPHSITATGNGTLEYSIDDGETWSTTNPSITNVGTLTVKVRVRGDSTHSTSEVAIGTVTITKRKLTKPTIANNAITYTGSEITATVSNYDSTIMTMTGQTSGTNAGAYSITVSLNNTSNYEWTDHTVSSVILPWQITKANQEKPNISFQPVPYDGQPHVMTVPTGVTLEYSLYSSGPWSTTPISRTDAGTTELYVRVKEDANHYASIASKGTIEITPALIPVPSINPSSYTYTGSSITPTITGYNSTAMNLDGDTSATNVGSYEIIVGLKNANYKWADDTTADLPYSWSITKADSVAPSVVNYSGTYDGQAHSVTVTGTGTIKYSTDGTTWSDVLPTMSDVGTMTVYVKTIGDANHNDSAVVSGEVHISKANLSAPTVTNYSGYYDGNAHTITVGTVSVGTIKYSTDGASWSTTKPTRTAVGKTTMYVKVFGNNNYNDSDTVVGTIEILDDGTYEIKNYTVDETNRYIKKIIVGTDLDTFKSNIILGYGYSVTVDTKTVNGKKLLYTGGKTRIFNGPTLVKEYTNIVIGDTNGDGLANSADILRLRQHLLGTKLITGVYFIASDVNYDNTINSADLLRERQHILGTKVIN